MIKTMCICVDTNLYEKIRAEAYIKKVAMSSIINKLLEQHYMGETNDKCLACNTPL